MTVGVVVMAYGTPASPEDIEPYYTHIRRGRPPTREQLDELTERYAAIGGISPLAQRTRAQVDAITAALDDAEPGRFVVRLGQKHAEPFVEDAVAALAAAGVERVVGVVLAPHYSGFSIGQYNERAATAAGESGLTYAGVESWSLEPAYLDHQAASVRERLAGLPERTKVVFTAHSLPERVLEGDPYPDQLRASAEAIAERAELGRWATWSIGWQSAGRTPEPWRGPDILDIIRELASTGRAEGVLVVPQGFTSDHLEVIYDLDIEAAAVAAEVGLAFARTDVVNDDAATMGTLAERLRELAGVNERHLVIVGGGITGLAAAWEASDRDGVRVTVLEVTDRPGGKLRTSAMTLEDDTELRIDEGADAFLARVPDAVRLCHELGLDDELTQPAIGRAKVFSGGALKFLPEDTVLGVPTDMDALAASGILSDEGLRAARTELERTGPGPSGDVPIGAFLAEHYGTELVDRVVGPLIGGINAGDIDELSLDAVTPQLADAAADGGSLTTALAARRTALPTDGPVFHAVLGGSGRLVDVLVEALVERGVELRLGTQLRQLRHDGGRWQLTLAQQRRHVGHTEVLDADAVVLSTPAPVAAELLAPLCPPAADELAAMTHSAVALATLVYRAEDVPTPMDASGFLVPRVEGLLLTAASWGSSKWAHWNDGRHVVLRVSAGRTGDERQRAMDDHELLDALRDDLATTMGISAAPVATRVARWPLGFTQYTVGHLDRVDRIGAALAVDCPTLALAGASYRGLGIPACIRQGRDAARQLLQR